MFAYIVRIFELPLVEFNDTEYVQINDYFKAFYLCFITITTVGYGDIVPHSWPGKFVMLGAAGIGAIVVSFIITIVQQHFEFNQK
jgi:potassium channel subfamily K